VLTAAAQRHSRSEPFEELLADIQAGGWHPAGCRPPAAGCRAQGAGRRLRRAGLARPPRQGCSVLLAAPAGRLSGRARCRQPPPHPTPPHPRPCRQLPGHHPLVQRLPRRVPAHAGLWRA
jgi:hypothetical protein